MASTANMPSGWRKQWATLYLSKVSPNLIPLSSFMEALQPILTGAWKTSQMPVYYSAAIDLRYESFGEEEEGEYAASYRDYVIDGGPFDGMNVGTNDRYVQAIKWNLQSKDGGPVTPSMVSTERTAIRQRLRNIFQSSFREAGRAIEGDRGVPATPNIPPPPAGAPVDSGMPLWPLLLAGAGALYVASK